MWAGSVSVVLWAVCTTCVVAYANDHSDISLESKVWQKESTLAIIPLVVSGFVFAFQSENGFRFVALGSGLLLGNILLLTRTAGRPMTLRPLASYLTAAAVSGFWFIPIVSPSLAGWIGSIVTLMATLTIVNWVEGITSQVKN